MFRLAWACIGVIILGFVLFLYGANFYEALVGWTGVFIILGGALAFLIIQISIELNKKGAAQNP